MSSHDSAIRSGLFLSALALVLALCSTSPLHPITVTLDHETLTVSPAGAIGVYPDELLTLVVTNTSRECYTFNLSEVKAEEREGGLLQAFDLEDRVEIPVVHRSGVVAYEVKVALKRDLGLEMRSQCTRPEHTFRIAVETYEWGLALAGAFTGDELTDPVYFLDEGIENPDDPPEMQRQGFFVRRDDKAQDSYRLGAAAVVHLFHNDPFRFDFKNGGSGAGLFHWAPISFGLGVGDESDTRYFVGTSLRFGQKAYLTAGWAFGSIARLPNGLDEGSFTTESNALGSLGSRTDSAFFLSLSFDFLKVGASSFLGAFETATPKPSEGKGSSGQGAGADTPQDDAAAVAKKTVEASIVASLAATDDTDRFRSAGIFKEGFQGDRFCTLTVTEEPLGATVEVNLASLVEPKVLTHPETNATLAEKKATIEKAVAELVAGHYAATASDVSVTLTTCEKP